MVRRTLSNYKLDFILKYFFYKEIAIFLLWGGIERDRGFTNYELTVKICFQSCSILQYHTTKELRKLRRKKI